MRRLLECGADVNHYSTRDSIALFEAVDSGVVEVVELLLSRQELDVDAIHPRRYNRTALMLAAQSGKLMIVNALLGRSGVKIYQKDLEGNTALSLATVAEECDIVETLLEHNDVDINSRNSFGNTALILAAGQCRDPVASVVIATNLLEKGADSSIKDHEGGGTAILRAIDAGNEAMVELLLKYRANIDIRDDLNRGLLHSAAINGYEGIVRTLLKEGVNFDTQDLNGKTPLHDASRHGNYEIARLLLDSGADQSIKDKHGRRPWTIAWQYGNLNVMRIFDGKETIEKQIEQDSYPEVHSLPIWSLVNLGFEQEIENMIATRSNEIYFCDPDLGNTAIHCAVDANNTSILTLLLDADLSPNSVNDYYRTPLHLAALHGHTHIFTILLNHKAKCDQKDKWLQTPIMIAYLQRHLECAVILIEAGADPTSSNMIQRLFFASIEFDRLVAVKKLIHLGADLSVKNVLGQTALQMAKEAGRDEIVQVLRANKSVFRPLRVGSEVTEEVLERDEEDEAEEEKMAMLSMKESPFHKPEVWNEEGSEDEGTVVADGGRTAMVHGKVPGGRVRILEPAV